MNQDYGKPYRSDPDFLILHTLRCIGVSSQERISTASGLSLGETVTRLHGHAERQLVALDPGPFGGWSLTGAGDITERDLTGVELDLAGPATPWPIATNASSSSIRNSFRSPPTGRSAGSAPLRT